MKDFATSLALLFATSFSAEVKQVGDDASLHCLDGNHFCQRTREWKIDQNDIHSPKDLGYAERSGSGIVTGSKVSFKLSIDCDKNTGYLA